MNPAGKPTFLKVLVWGAVAVAAMVALLWLAKFTHFFTDVVVHIIRFFAN